MFLRDICKGISLLSDGSEPDISDETKFAEFIKNKEINAYDSDGAYFRWTANLSLKEKLEEVNAAIAARFEANAANVKITKADGTEGTAADLAGFGIPGQITVDERCAYGAVKQLSISYEKGTVTLFSEYNVRTVLGAAATQVTDKNGEELVWRFYPVRIVPWNGGGWIRRIWRRIRAWYRHEPEWGERYGEGRHEVCGYIDEVLP